ncbi:hypothetical protein ACHAPT_009509 [Fusarium lateritium]
MDDEILDSQLVDWDGEETLDDISNEPSSLPDETLTLPEEESVTDWERGKRRSVRYTKMPYSYYVPRRSWGVRSRYDPSRERRRLAAINNFEKKLAQDRLLANLGSQFTPINLQVGQGSRS